VYRQGEQKEGETDVRGGQFEGQQKRERLGSLDLELADTRHRNGGEGEGFFEQYLAKSLNREGAILGCRDGSYVPVF